MGSLNDWSKEKNQSNFSNDAEVFDHNTSSPALVKMDLSKNYGFECKGFDTVCLTMELDLEYKRSFLASLFAPCSSR